MGYESNEEEEKNKDEDNQKETQVALTTISKTSRYVQKNHSKNQTIGYKNRGVIIRRKVVEEQVILCLLSKFEPKKVEEAYKDQNWMKAMKEELDQIEKNQTWELVSRSIDKNVIGTKWMFQDNLGEDGQAVRNKERLECKG